MFRRFMLDNQMMKRSPIFLLFLLLTWLYSTLLPEPRAAELTCVWQRSPGISPLRGSLRAAPIACVCGWTESSGLAGSLQDSLPKLLLDGRGPLAAFLGRLLCRHCLHRQVFALPPHCCSPSSGVRQPTLLVAGYSVFKGQKKKELHVFSSHFLLLTF